MLTADTISKAIRSILTERNLCIVKPQHPTMGEVALEAYGFGKACDAVALQGDDLDALLAAMSVRIIAATITDEQIRELKFAPSTTGELHALCSTALGMYGGDEDKRIARERVSKIIAERSK